MNKKKPLILGVSAVVLLLLLGVGGYSYMYYSSPAHIRHPTYEHYHFRTQIIVDGQPVDFSREEFQTETANTCSIDPGGTPVDFHDGMNQLAHIHWNGMTGGEFLKYFGWNMIGGDNDTLGYRYEGGMMGHRESVMTAGNLLPNIPEDSNFYVYAGDQNGYEQKSLEDFLNQNLEDFFGKQSNLKQTMEQTSWLERTFLPNAYAHGGAMDGDEEPSDKSEEELTRINNLVGNVVIFVQKDEPSKEQIEERFKNLVPLHDSVCGD